MAIYKNRGIELFIDVTKSEQKKRLIVGWQNPDGSIGGHADMTDLFFSIRDYWEQTTRASEDYESYAKKVADDISPSSKD